MPNLTTEKLEQAAELVREAAVDVWLTFDRETAEGGDPVLPLIIEGGLTWQTALIISKTGRRIAIAGNYDCPPIEASGDWHEVIPYVQSIRQPLVETLEKLVPAGIAKPRIAVNYSTTEAKSTGSRLQWPRQTAFSGSWIARFGSE